MPIFKSLSDSPDLMELFRRFSDGVRPLCELHDIFLRGDSPLSVAERELIAAYVSGLNACNYCFGAHSMIAEAHGVEPALFNFMNRIVDGTGIKPSAESDANRRARLESTSESSSYYRDFARVVLRDNIKTDSKS